MNTLKKLLATTALVGALVAPTTASAVSAADKSQGWANIQGTWCMRVTRDNTFDLGRDHNEVGYRGSIGDDDGTCNSYNTEASWTTWTKMVIREDGFDWGDDMKCRYLHGRVNYDKDFLFPGGHQGRWTFHIVSRCTVNGVSGKVVTGMSYEVGGLYIYRIEQPAGAWLSPSWTRVRELSCLARVPTNIGNHAVCRWTDEPDGETFVEDFLNPGTYVCLLRDDGGAGGCWPTKWWRKQ